MQLDAKEMGRADSLRYNVLHHVVSENYDRAIDDLKSALEKKSVFPSFREKAERFASHAVDLVNAIRAKRHFPGIDSLTMAKQEEISDRYMEHFRELQTMLKKGSLL